MNVSKRMTVSFGVVVGLSCVATLAAVVMLLIVKSNYSKALEHYGFIQGDIGRYTTYLNEERILIRDIVTLTDQNRIATLKSQLEEVDVRNKAQHQALAEKVVTDTGKAYVNSMISGLQEYHTLRKEVIALDEAGNTLEAYVKLQYEAAPIAAEIVKQAEALLDYSVSEGYRIAEKMDTLSRLSMVIVLVLMLLAAACGMTYARYTALDIARPIKEMREATHKLALGELDALVAVTDNNEFGEMAKDFNAATAKLKEYVDCLDWGLTQMGTGDFTVEPTVEFQGDFINVRDAIINILVGLSFTLRQINEGSDQVSLGAQHLAENSQLLAEGASSQQDAVEELNATIEGVAEAASDSAKKADDAYKSAQRFANVAEQSNKEMKLLTEAMERITATSKEIESIIGEIEDIASQTNLLSLNASIEAARAGEAGRGFAVVADQIGKLASDSAQSAVNTKNLIVKSLQEIKNGNDITARTTAALGEVIEGIKILAKISQETSELSKEQAETMAQIRGEIEKITDVVTDNSATAEETSATSQELLAQAENLKAMVEQFNLLEDV